MEAWYSLGAVGCCWCWWWHHMCMVLVHGTGYDHFRAENAKCVLFEAQEIARWNAMMNQHRNLQQEIGRIVREQRDPQVRLVRCGQCRAETVVLDNNNHVHCW